MMEIGIRLETLNIAAIFVIHDSRDWGTDLQLACDLLRSPEGCLGTAFRKFHQSVGQKQEDGEENHILYRKQHIPIYFSNPDFLWANEFPLPRFGQGAFKTALKAIWMELTGSELKYFKFGKPETVTYDYAYRTLMDQISFDLSKLPEIKSISNEYNPVLDIYAIGDNPLADIVGANRHGWYSFLVRTGVYQDGDPSYGPSKIVDHVEEAIEVILERYG